VRTRKKDSIFKRPFLITILLFLTLWGCGSGGGGSRSGASEFVGSGSSGSGGSEFGDNGSGGNSQDGDAEGSDPGTGPTPDNSVTLVWDNPDGNSDGSDLNDLAGYKIYYGTSSGNYTQSIDVGNITSAAISNLSSGTWCFATTAYDTSGNESDYSNEACKTI